MSEPEVTDITFDRPDYTAGAFIVFTGQTSDVAPPGEFWARKGFRAGLVGEAEVRPESPTLVINLTVSPGWRLILTDLIVAVYGKIGIIGGRYDTVSPPSYPRTSVCPASVELKVDYFLQDYVRVDDKQPYFHKSFKTPLVLEPGDNLRVEATSELGTVPVRVVLIGYWTYA